MVSACLDGKPMLRNGTTGDWVGTFVGHKGAVWAVHINSLATLVATGSADYTAKVWDALSGEEKQSFAHSRIIKSVNFSTDNKRLLSGGQDKILRIFDLEKPEADPLKLEGHADSIKNALWTSNNTTIVSGGQDSTLRIWDVRTLKEVKSINLKAPVGGIEVSLDGKHLTTAAGREVSFWDIKTFELVKTYSMAGTDANSASLSPDGSTFVVGGSDFWAHVHDFATGKELEVHKGHHGPVHVIRFAPDGETFASGSEDGTIRLWQSGDSHTYGLWEENKDAKVDTENA
jgi:serine-threonine kinase receptor-associated protein